MSFPVHTYSTLDDWITQETIPFSPDSVSRILTSLDDSVELLGMGEALHGGEEILLLRNRIFQRLAGAHGYTAIAIESSFPRARFVNDYVLGRGGNSYESIQDSGFGHGFGKLDTNRELVEWMKKYNQDPSHTVKLHFYGFDLPGVTAGPASPREVLDFVLDYLSSIDITKAEKYRKMLVPLLGENSNWENPMVWHDPTQSVAMLSALATLRITTEDLMTDFQVCRPQWIAQSDESRYAEAVHYVIVTRQLLNFYSVLATDPNYAGSLAVRDALMTDNLLYILKREHGRGKVFAFAHNAHLQRGKVTIPLGTQVSSWFPAGSHLHQLLGARYAVLATAVGVSEANGIGKPETGTLEARLTAIHNPVRFIPTHQGQGLPAAEMNTLPVRTGSKKNPTYVPLTSQSFFDFDGLLVLDSTTYNRGGRPLQ